MQLPGCTNCCRGSHAAADGSDCSNHSKLVATFPKPLTIEIWFTNRNSNFQVVEVLLKVSMFPSTCLCSNQMQSTCSRSNLHTPVWVKSCFDLSPINKYKKGFFSGWEQSCFQVTMFFPHESLWKPNSLLLFPLNEKACFPASREGNSLISFSSPWLHNSRGSPLILIWDTEISAMLKKTPQAVSELLQNNLLKMPWKEMKAYFLFSQGMELWCANKDVEHNSAPMSSTSLSWLIRCFHLHINCHHA